LRAIYARLGDSVTEVFGPLRGATAVRSVRCHFGTRVAFPPKSYSVSPLLDELTATCVVPWLPPEDFWKGTPPRALLGLSFDASPRGDAEWKR
jgi:hypothetical protein